MQSLLVLVALVSVEFGAIRKMIVADRFSTETVLYVMQSMPRFQPENFAHNAKLFDQVNEIAQRKGCTPSQLALAWVHHQGGDVVPIPGTTKIENFNQNIGALSVKLTPEEMAELESIASADSVKGGRYASNMPTWEDSDTPPLTSWKAV
ncbi:hypothetical protein NL676_021582 [Syzygium grande]|nr:hypothetical protein NL676_021582 [Syzygium grande]